jgi:hypothetical protein
VCGIGIRENEKKWWDAGSDRAGAMGPRKTMRDKEGEGKGKGKEKRMHRTDY